jgi:dUTP pyrophosphatase
VGIVTNDVEFVILNTESALELLSRMYEADNVAGVFLPKSELFDFFYSLKKKYYDCADVKYTSENYKLSKTHFTDAGVDVFCTELEKVLDNVILLKTGLKVEVPVGYWGMLCPRSSIIKTGFTMANSFGVIDSSYRGELKVSLMCTGDVNNGLAKLEELLPHKFAQLIFIKQTLPSFTLVENLKADTNRGEGGHGSTDSNTSKEDNNVSE